VPVVTSLESESRSGGIRIQLDGAPFVTVGAADVAGLGVRLGAELAPPRVADLERCADVFGARAVALRMLAARALPSVELERRLVRRGHGPEAAKVAVAALVASGLVDDAEFARHFARTRAQRRRVGPVRLERELRRFGVAPADAQAAVHDALEADGVDVASLLREAALRKQKSLAGKDPKAARRSLRAYLLRQGFGASDIAALLRSTR